MFVVSPKLLTAAFLCLIHTWKAFSRIYNVFAHASVMIKAVSSCTHMACRQISLYLCFGLSETFCSSPPESHTVSKFSFCLLLLKINTDGLVLRGWYTCLTLAVYGTAERPHSHERDSPPPPPPPPPQQQQLGSKRNIKLGQHKHFYTQIYNAIASYVTLNVRMCVWISSRVGEWRAV